MSYEHVIPGVHLISLLLTGKYQDVKEKVAISKFAYKLINKLPVIAATE